MTRKRAAKRRTKPRKKAASSSAAPKRRLLKFSLLALGVLAGLFLPWMVYLDHTVKTEFEGRKWDLPSRVYARPLTLFPGQPMTGAFLLRELQAAGYREAAGANRPGSYSRNGDRFTIYSRDFQFADRKQAALRFQVSVGSGEVAGLADHRGQAISLARLDPAEIGSIYPLHNEDRSVVRLDQVPPLLITGLQAVEDRQFKHHYGVDLKAIARALWANLRHRRVVQGGSTITQQLVKNYFLSHEQTVLRKLNEAMMAVLLEWRYSKPEILEAYLNEVWLGQQGARAIHGFGRAAEYYFNQPLERLDGDQLALLIGLVKGASYYNPRRHPERALDRRNQVLKAFLDTGLMDAAAYAAARGRPLQVTAQARSGQASYPAFIDLVKRQLRDQYREQDLRSEGLRIFTTLEPATQAAAEQSAEDGLSALAAAGLPEDLQSAMVVVDIHNGEIQALVGDRLAGRVGFNRALDARRQIGSVIKPLVYLQALQHPETFNLLTEVEDLPVELRLANGDLWQPRNYDGESHGTVTLLEALSQSYNQATVQVGLKVGVPNIVQTLGLFNLQDAVEPVPSILLGAAEFTPLEVAQVYQSLAAGGYTSPLRAVTAVLDANGTALSRYPLNLSPLPRRDAVALVNYALTQVVDKGTGRGLRRWLPSDLTVAGKTGTTNERRDSWFVGYTRNRLGVVWVGLDDNRPAGVTGSNAALQLWGRAFARLPLKSLTLDLPEGVGWYWVDPVEMALATEDCPGAAKMPFAEAALPARYASCTANGRSGRGASQKTPWWRKWFGKNN